MHLSHSVCIIFKTDSSLAPTVRPGKEEGGKEREKKSYKIIHGREYEILLLSNKVSSSKESVV